MLVFLAEALADPVIGTTATVRATDATQNIAINFCAKRPPIRDLERVEADASLAKTFKFMFPPRSIRVEWNFL
jgi:hypothetical protein